MPDLSWFTNLLQSPLNLGVIVGVIALLVLGKDAPAKPLVSWLLKLVPKVGPPPTSAAGGDDCQAALMCILNHAAKAGDKDLLAKLLEIVEPVNAMHEAESRHIATRIS